jgi:hypothetical protein
MRLLLLVSIAWVAGWFAAAPPGTGAEKSLREKTQELLVGRWEGPQRPGNGWEFDKGGRFAASISAGVIRSHTGGTYRVLEDGSLELRVVVGNQVSEPLKCRVRVTKDRLTFIDDEGKEDSYRRAK